MSYWKRILTLVTALAMLTGLAFPMAAYATEYQEITAGQAVLPDENDEICILKFVPETDGWYAFWSEGQNTDPRGRIWNDDLYEENDDGGEYWNFMVKAQLTAGETYYLRAAWAYDPGCSVTLHLDALVPATGVTMTPSEFSGYTGSYFYPEYSFEPMLSIPQEVTLTSSDENIVTVWEDGTVMLKAPGTATVTLTTEGGLTASTSVEVKEVLPIHCGDSVELSADQETYRFHFVPETTGWYYFYSTDAQGNPYCEILDEWFDYIDAKSGNPGDPNFRSHIRLMAGHDYYFQTSPQGGDCTVHLVQAVAPTGLTLSREEFTGYCGDVVDLFVKYIPEFSSPETVNWTSSDETVASVYEGYVSLLNPGTAVITATSQSGLTASCTVTCKDSDGSIVCGEAVAPDREAGKIILTFTAPTNGWYGFYSTGEGMDPRANLWGNNLDEYDDDSGKYGNFLIKTQLTAGETYYLSTVWYDDGEGNLEIHVDSLIPGTSLDLNFPNFSGLVGESFDLTCEIQPMLHIPEEITWVSSDETVATVNPYGYVELVGAGTAIITAYTPSNLTAECPVTVKGVEGGIICGLTVIPDLRDNSILLSFTPEADGWYGFYSTGEGMDPWGQLMGDDQTYHDDDGGEDANFLVKAHLTAEQTYMLYAEWHQNDPDAFLELHVDPLTAAEALEFGHTEMEAYINNGFYLDEAFQPLLSIPEEITWESSNEAVATVEEDGYVFLVSVGTAIITATSESGLTATCTVTCTDSDGNLTCDEPVVPDIDKGQCLLTFIPDTDGWYGFYSVCTNTDPDATFWCDEFYIHNDDGGEGRNFLITAELKAGETYFLRSSWYLREDRQVTLEIHAAPLGQPETLVLHQTEVDDYPGSSFNLYYHFLPMLSIPEQLTWSSSDETVATVDDYGCVTLIAPGTVTITATSESGPTATCEITVRNPETLVCGQPLVTNQKDVRFRFVPETDGWYTFYSSGENVDPYCELLDKDLNWITSNDDNLNSNHFLVTVALQAGQVYYLNAHNGSGRSFKVHVEKTVDATALILPESQIEEVGCTLYLQATFEPIYAHQEAVTWSSSDETIATVNEYGEVTLLNPGTVIITVTSEKGLTASCTVTSRGIDPLLPGNPVELTDDGTRRFTFTPDSDGWYAFYSLGNDTDPYCYLYDETYENILASDDDTIDSTNFRISYQLEAGKTYLLSISFYRFEENGTCQIVAEKLTAATGLILSQTQIVGKLYGYNRLDAIFQPANAIEEEITWVSSDETIVQVHDGELWMLSFGTVTITATSESGLTASCTVTVQEPEDMILDQVYACGTENDEHTFRFVPQVSGWYGFFTTGDQDTYLELYGEENEYWYDDDNGTDWNALLAAELTAGKPYYLVVGPSETDNAYTLQATRLIQPTDFRLNTQNLVIYADSEAYVGTYRTLPSPCITPVLTWVSSNTDVAQVDQEGCVTAVNPGTAVITVTTDNGLHDTMEVTVLPAPEGADSYGNCGDTLLYVITDGVLTITGTGDMWNGWYAPTATQVSLPQGITGIGSYAFESSDFTTIEIPASVKWIGHRAFAWSSLTEIHFLGNAPEMNAGIFEELVVTAYYPAGDPTWTEEVKQSYNGNVTWLPEGEALPQGVTLYGQITAFSDADAMVELIQYESLVAEAVVFGKIGTYELTNLTPGSYTLRISKAGHVTRCYAVTVGEEDITLNAKLHLPGDISGDGKVNVADTSKVYAHAKGVGIITDEYLLACADINGDGKINVADTSKIYAHAKGTTPLW